jgi:hypothetical protein
LEAAVGDPDEDCGAKVQSEVVWCILATTRDPILEIPAKELLWVKITPARLASCITVAVRVPG